jgi:7,8-dihydropterin-6-yl-methyl-4-(beta-D-ribofuranosyl)aminobenzene 5'-phosphate synthase
MTADSLPLLSEWGAAYIIDTPKKRILFDTGLTGRVLLHNLEALNVAVGSIDAIVLSHAHTDHSGGLEAILRKNGGIPFYANGDLFKPRFKIPVDEPISIGMPVDKKWVKQYAAVFLSDRPQMVAGGVWTSGRIVERREKEGRSPFHYIRENDTWIADPYRDDLSMVLETEKGLVLLCGCCHAGLLNTMIHVKTCFKQEIVAVLGGIHLLDAGREDVLSVIDFLKKYGTPELYLNHCTGEQVIDMLRQEFGPTVKPFKAGDVLEWP